MVDQGQAKESGVPLTIELKQALGSTSPRAHREFVGPVGFEGLECFVASCGNFVKFDRVSGCLGRVCIGSRGRCRILKTVRFYAGKVSQTNMLDLDVVCFGLGCV